mgnify:CR=1 FL=1
MKDEFPRHFFILPVILLGLILGTVIKLFVIDILLVSGKSMFPAIKDGERILVNRLSYGIAKPFGDKLSVQWGEPERGDVVIYLYNDKIVVKRCVAVGGDSLFAQKLDYSQDFQYTLSVESLEIPLTEVQYLSFREIDSVPAGYILAVGDNYEESVDSRAYGFVSVQNVLGRVIGK